MHLPVMPKPSGLLTPILVKIWRPRSGREERSRLTRWPSSSLNWSFDREADAYLSLSLPSRYPVRFPTEIQQLYLLRYLTLSGRHSMPSSHAENGRAEGFAYRITLSSLHRLERNIVHYHECSHMVKRETIGAPLQEIP